MMKSIIFILVVLMYCMVISGCKKKDNIIGGGKGGTSVINMTGEAHGLLLDTCIIYIKYGTQNAPANGIYDDSMVCVMVNGTPVAQFDSLTVGNYYFLAIGYHGAFSEPNVDGGKTITISQEGDTIADVMQAAPFLPPYPYIIP